MSKDKLSIASTDPVSLDDTDSTPAAKTDDSKSAAVSEPEPETSKLAAKDTKEATEAEEKPKDGATKETDTAKSGVSDEEDAPPPPARPLSPAAQIKKDLKEAFPQIEDKYIEAVLIASEGQADPAFNALLFLLDPSFKPEPVPVARKPAKPRAATITDDELLARQLQKEFEKEDRRRRSRTQHKLRPQQRVESDDSPDEFDQIKETFSQGFEEAKTTINSWVSGISKKFSQEDSQEQRPQRGGAKQSPKLFGALGGSSFNNNTRKGKNFDDDPEILALDFRKSVDLDSDIPPQLPKREETTKPQDKWQPLNSDVPVKSDAFLVTDSEDEDKK